MSDTPTHFSTAAQFRAWLRKSHRKADSIILRIAKAHAADRGIAYAEALDEALCFGWIDGVRRRLDEDSFSIRFTPRKPRSIWSLVNVRHAERLIEAERMSEAGLAAFAARAESRTGVYSFEQRPTTLAPEYAKRFRAAKRAWRYFNQEAPSYRGTSTYWVMSAKRPETRRKRLAILMACSTRGERIPQLRRAPAGVR